MKDLKYFIRRAEVLRNYRSLLKVSRNIRKHDKDVADGAVEQIRLQFRVNRDIESPTTISVLIRDAEDAFNRLHSVYRAIREPVERAKEKSWYSKGGRTDVRGRAGRNYPWNKPT